MTGALAVAAERVTAGPLGLLVVLLMGLATVLLIRNMSKRLKRLPEQFPPPEDGEQPKSSKEPSG